MPAATPLVDAPIVYSDANIVVTPMAGRLRATSFMEFVGADEPPDWFELLTTRFAKAGETPSKERILQTSCVSSRQMA